METRLKDIVDVLRMQPQGSNSYFDTESGELLTIMDEEFEQARSDKPIESFTQWEQGPIAMARDVLGNKKQYIKLPDTSKKNELVIIGHFCSSLKDPVVSETLLAAVEDQDSLRQFKEGLSKFGLNEEWFEFRIMALNKLARLWCKKNNVTLED